MGELVGEHPLELVTVELVQQAAGHGHRGVRRIATGGKCIRRAVFDDVHPWLGDPGADRQLLDDVVQLGLLLVPDFVRLRHAEHDLVTGEVGHEGRATGNRQRKGQDEEAGISAHRDGTQDVGEQRHQPDKEPDQQPGAPAVAGDLVVDVDVRGRRVSAAGDAGVVHVDQAVGVKLTFGTSRSDGVSTSKYSDAVKPNAPASTTVGKVCKAVL